MRVTDDDLRSVLTERAASRQACPRAEALAAAAAGALADAEREVVIEHLARCRDCAEEVRLVAPLGSWAEAAAAQLRPAPRPAAAGNRRAWWRPWPVYAAAAAVLLALPFVLRRDSTPATMRALEGLAIRSLLAEGAPVPPERCVLRWSDLGPGARYSVSVLSKDLRPLASADGLERAEYAVAPEALKGVPSGAEIVWSIEARWPDGRRIASPMFVTRLLVPAQSPQPGAPGS